MDKFGKDAFKKAEEQRLYAEANAWCAVPEIERRAVDKAALLAAGLAESAMLILAVEKVGLTDTLHSYAIHCMMGGFSLGYKAGQESMLEK